MQEKNSISFFDGYFSYITFRYFSGGLFFILTLYILQVYLEYENTLGFLKSLNDILIQVLKVLPYNSEILKFLILVIILNIIGLILSTIYLISYHLIKKYTSKLRKFDWYKRFDYNSDDTIDELYMEYANHNIYKNTKILENIYGYKVEYFINYLKIKSPLLYNSFIKKSKLYEFAVDIISTIFTGCFLFIINLHDIGYFLLVLMPFFYYTTYTILHDSLVIPNLLTKIEIVLNEVNKKNRK